MDLQKRAAVLGDFPFPFAEPANTGVESGTVSIKPLIKTTAGLAEFLFSF